MEEGPGEGQEFQAEGTRAWGEVLKGTEQRMGRSMLSQEGGPVWQEGAGRKLGRVRLGREQEPDNAMLFGHRRDFDLNF